MMAFYRITAFWYTRLLLFVLCAVVALYVLTLVVPYPEAQESYAVLLLVSLAVEQLRKGGSAVLLGFPARWMLRHTAFGVALGLVMIAALGLAAVLCGAEVRVVGGVQPAEIFATIGLIAVMAAGEEILFRGVVFQALYERFGAAMTTVVTSLLFTLAHMGNPNITVVALLNIFLAGVLFSFMYTSTRALWMPWAFHWSWNAAQYLFLGSAVSGMSMGMPVLELLAPDSAWYRFFIADAFGVEGGFLAFLLLVAGLVVVSLPRIAQPAPELAARLFRRQYAESKLRYALRTPWGKAPAAPL